MRAQFVALAFVEGAFQQGAENRGFDGLPVFVGGTDQQGDLLAVQRQGFGIGKETAVEF